jgi:hypothetical protein
LIEHCGKDHNDNITTKPRQAHLTTTKSCYYSLITQQLIITNGNAMLKVLVLILPLAFLASSTLAEYLVEYRVDAYIEQLCVNGVSAGDNTIDQLETWTNEITFTCQTASKSQSI